MEITLTLKDIAILAIAISVVVLIAYCISLVKNLIITVKRTNYILEDAMSISKIAADRTQEIDSKITSVAANFVKVVNLAKTKEPKGESENPFGKEDEEGSI